MKSGDLNLSLEQAIQLADEAYRIREFGPLTVQGKALVVLLSRVRELEGEAAGWTLCDYGNEATLPPMGELVELAVVNNGKMARTFGGRVACDEAWAWASAEPQLLWAGLPVGLDDLFEWDEDEARTVYWRKLAPLPPPPTDLPNGQNGA